MVGGQFDLDKVAVGIRTLVVNLDLQPKPGDLLYTAGLIGALIPPLLPTLTRWNVGGLSNRNGARVLLDSYWYMVCVYSGLLEQPVTARQSTVKQNRGLSMVVLIFLGGEGA